MLEGKDKEIAALFLLVLFFPAGYYFISLGTGKYNETSVQVNAYVSYHPISFTANVTYANLTTIEWNIATPSQDSADSEWKSVELRFGTIQVNYTMDIELPNEASNVRGLGYSPVNSTYVSNLDYYTFAIIPTDHIVIVYFSWRIFNRWSYDTYSIEMPLYPFFYNCGADSFNVSIVSPKQSLLDLSRTYPYPSSSEGIDSPTYFWETDKPQDIRETFAGRLQAFFVFPEKTGQVKSTTFQAGIFTGLGVTMIIGGFTNTIMFISSAVSVDSWTRSKIHSLKDFFEQFETLQWDK